MTREEMAEAIHDCDNKLLALYRERDEFNEEIRWLELHKDALEMMYQGKEVDKRD